MKYIFLLFLLICAIRDFRTRRIPVIWLYGGLAWMGIYACCQLIHSEREMSDLIFAILPGAICYFFVKLSHAMGMGDALLIIGMGFCFPVITVIEILMVAFLFAAIGSIALLVTKRGMKNMTIPFVPYLLASSGFILIR